MKRRCCDGCGRPEKVCLCSHLKHCELPFELIIWQDPDEAKHPLSTAPLLDKSIANCRLIVGDQCLPEELLGENDFSDVALLYPLEGATPLPMSEARSSVSRVLVLDGTWRKVRRLLLLNPWLKTLPCLSLTPDSESRYLRQSQVEQGVSTLEAVYLLADVWQPESGYLEGIAVLDRMAELQDSFRR